MTPGRGIRFIVPDGIDDPHRVSGGNVYDRHVRDGLRERGWTVLDSRASDGAAVTAALQAAPDGALVLVDGLAAGWAPADVEGAASRVRLVLLQHMVASAFPDTTDAAAEVEQRVAGCARRVIVTSRWTGAELVRRGIVEPDRITVASPGVEAAPAVAGDKERNLLCVGVIAPHKGQDTLLAALALLPDADWTCAIVGSGDTFPEFASRIAREAARFGGRVSLAGVLTGEALAAAYRDSALLVAPSRVESAGMAIADARARGMPVVAAATGGIPDMVAGGGALLVPPDDPAALAEALEAWMTDPALRARLRRAALEARTTLPRWDDTMTRITAALEAAA